MSRGLGRQQRLFLLALAELESQEGAGWYYTWAVLNEAGRLGLEDHVNQYQQRRDAAYAEWDRQREAAIARHRADTAAAAAGGSPDAITELKRLDDLDRHLAVLGAAIRASSRRRRPQGAPKLRTTAGVEAAVNPSRILLLLERRGLVERNAGRGPGASVRLTDAGRRGASL